MLGESAFVVRNPLSRVLTTTNKLPALTCTSAFQVDRKLGEGSFGVVFKVRSLDDGRWYAGQAWEEDSRLYIQTELCECSLAAYAEKHHSLPEQLVWEFLVDLLLGVKHMHDHNLAHLDIKPENIFISKDGYYKLGDFGLVLDLNQAADIFSLGITVLELACDLELPSRGESWHALRSGTLPRHFTQSLSPQLRVVMEQMMHPDPKQRITVDQLLAISGIYRLSIWRRLYVARRRVVRWVTDLLLLTWFWVLPFLKGAWKRVSFPCIKMPVLSSRPSVTRRTPVQDAHVFSDDETFEDHLNQGHGMHEDISGVPSRSFEHGLSDGDYSPPRSPHEPLLHRRNRRLHSTPMAVSSSRRPRLNLSTKPVPFNLSWQDGTFKKLFPVNEGNSSSGEDLL
ncbi:hypothetical protein MTO96_028792 [Rhipicephalus appendiculatus]